MNDEYSKAYADICYILSILEEKYTDVIPEELKNFFRENADIQYLPSIDITKPLTEQKINEKTEQLICLLNLNYWCTPTEKEQLLKKYEANEREIQEMLRNKYEIKFKKPPKIEDVKAIMVIEKESFFKRAIKYIKKFFKIK